MRIFRLERYFAKHEFKANHLLSASDSEPLSLSELLEMATAETRQRWDNLSFHYTDSQGDPQLRAEIASQYQHLSPEDFLVIAPEEGIYIAMHMMLRKSDHFIALLPAYQSLHEIAATNGCKFQPLLLTPKEGRWHLDLQQLDEMIHKRTRLLVLNFPHNPTGFMPTLAELEAIVEIARKHQLLIFSDEMYRPLSYEKDQLLPSLADLYENAVVLSGVSKTLSLPGLRIGWLGTRHKALMQNFRGLRDYTTICSSAPSEILALMGLQAKAVLLQRNQARINRHLLLAKTFCQRHPSQIEWLSPQGGSVCFPLWKGRDTIEEIAESLVQEKGVMLLPGNMFDEGEGHFRLGLGRDDFGKALEIFDEFLASSEERVASSE